MDGANYETTTTRSLEMTFSVFSLPLLFSLRSRRYLGRRAKVGKAGGGGEECQGERKRAKKNGRGETEIAPAGKPYVFSYLPKSRPLKNSQSVIRRN